MDMGRGKKGQGGNVGGSRHAPPDLLTYLLT